MLESWEIVKLTFLHLRSQPAVFAVNVEVIRNSIMQGSMNTFIYRLDCLTQQLRSIRKKTGMLQQSYIGYQIAIICQSTRNCLTGEQITWKLANIEAFKEHPMEARICYYFAK